MVIEKVVLAAFVFVTVFIFSWLVGKQASDQIRQYQASFSETTRARFYDLFMFVDTARLFRIYVSAIIGVPLLAYLFSHDFVIAFLFLAVTLVAPNMIYKYFARKRLKDFEKQLPDAIMMVSGAIKSGASLSIALEAMVRESPAPLSQDFSLLLRETKLGIDLDTALENMEKRVELQDLTMFLSALRVSREVGGNLAETLESLADTLRRKITMEGKIDSLTAQGKIQGVVMSLLPLGLMGVLMKIEPEAMSKMFTTRIGLFVFSTIIAMQLLGYLAIRKITSIDV